jgi:hypothetical protein
MSCTRARASRAFRQLAKWQSHLGQTGLFSRLEQWLESFPLRPGAKPSLSVHRPPISSRCEAQGQGGSALKKRSNISSSQRPSALAQALIARINVAPLM